MRYLSVCSGIEAATVAWHPLGWTPVGFSEIEPFPSAVLAHHYPNVPNYGDMTKHEEWPIGPGTVDLLVGGTPCQSFSVAGLRRGLTDPRGGLMLTYLEIARRLRPRWVVWENVPGVLSSNGGRDFGSFTGALGQLGYGWAYRVLDAQWVRTQRHPRAVPQRRRRVFVVGCLGDPARAAQVLFERESVQRDSAPRRAQGEGSAADAEAGAGAGCITSHDVAPCLETTSHDYSRADGFTMVAGTLGNRGLRSHTEIDGHGAYIPQPVPFTKSKRAQSVTDDKTWVDGKVNPTLSLFDQGDTRATTVAVAFAQNQIGEVRTSEVSGTLNTNSNPSGRNTPMAAVAFKPGQSAQARSIGAELEVACTLEAGGGGNNKQAVAYGTDCYNGAITGDVAATMGTPGSSVNASGPTVMAAVGFNWQNGGGYGNANDGLGITVEGTGPLQRCNTPAVAHALRAEGFDASEDGTGRGTPLVPVAPTLTAHNDPSRSPQSAEVTQQVAAVHAASMTVRRLTPRECERLQGFPDDYTMIPWRRKPASDCPDGPRYKALGNSMAVNCMAWIGERIAAVDAATPSANRPSEG